MQNLGLHLDNILLSPVSGLDEPTYLISLPKSLLILTHKNTKTLYLHSSISQRVVLGPVVSVSPGNFLEMQIPRSKLNHS